MVGIAVPTIRLSSMASSIAIISARTTTRTLRAGGSAFAPAAAFLSSVMPSAPLIPCCPVCHRSGTYLPPG